MLWTRADHVRYRGEGDCVDDSRTHFNTTRRSEGRAGNPKYSEQMSENDTTPPRKRQVEPENLLWGMTSVVDQTLSDTYPDREAANLARTLPLRFPLLLSLQFVSLAPSTE